MKDAQGFRFENHKKIPAKLIDASIYHYGWARAEEVMKRKLKALINYITVPTIKMMLNLSTPGFGGLKSLRGANLKL